MEKKTILAIHAHPDDVEILGGGTVAQLAALGHRMVIVTMTPGDCGTHDYPPEEIAAIRRAEAARSAAPHRRRIPVRRVSRPGRLQRRRLAAARDRSPAPGAAGPGADRLAHRLHGGPRSRQRAGAGRLFRRARAELRHRTRPTPAPAAAGHPAPLFHGSPWAAWTARTGPSWPDFYVDVDARFSPPRAAMLAEHKSQREWLLKHHGIDDYLLNMERWTRLHGARAGRGVRRRLPPLQGHPYPETPLLEELLGTAGGYRSSANTISHSSARAALQVGQRDALVVAVGAAFAVLAHGTAARRRPACPLARRNAPSVAPRSI